MRRHDLPDFDHIIDMIGHCHEQIEEELSSFLHLHLHRATAFEGLAAADDESEVMCAESRVAWRRVRICETCTAQDGRHVNAGLQTLFPESKALQIRQAEAQGSAVDDCVAEDIVTHTTVVDDSELVETLSLIHI